MKKNHLLTSFVFLFFGLIMQLECQAAGRLNFMLTNLTPGEIVEVRIAPTYYPTYQSDNLLNTKLDPSTRLYIGPNFYGQEYFWNISLTWSNGFKYTWTHNRLSNYNSYTVYANNYGIKMRQGYEPAFARYGGGPMPTLYSGSNPSVSVEVGVVEKVNVSHTVTAQASVGASKRKTRDLVFDDDEANGANTTAEGGAKSAGSETIAVKATVELTRDGKISTVLPTEDFKSGDKVRLIFSANREGRTYWVSKGTSGSYQVLFPSAKAGMDNTVVKNREYTVPAKGAWKFDENKGTEVLVCFLSPEPIAALDKAVQLASEGKKDEASSTIAPLLEKHETKRKTRDLVFEEEDDKDVNTKTQISKGNEPFVATYELSHK